MHISHTNSLRAFIKGDNVLLPIEYNDDDDLVCYVQDQQIEVESFTEHQFDELLNVLVIEGLKVSGCFNCTYFHQPGDFDGDSSTLGYCLWNKLNCQVSVGEDTTTKGASCDMIKIGSIEDQSKTAQAWSESIH